MSSAISFNLDQSKILSSGNGLKSDNIVLFLITLPAKACKVVFRMQMPSQWTV